MGQHKNNPAALAKAARPPEGMPQFQPGEEVYGFQFETALELNAASMQEVNETAAKARAAGEDERRAVHLLSKDWNGKAAPERFDLVIYNRIQVGRPSALLPDPRQVPTAFLRISEHLRMPLTEVRKRADETFAEHEKRGKDELQ